MGDAGNLVAETHRQPRTLATSGPSASEEQVMPTTTTRVRALLASACAAVATVAALALLPAVLALGAGWVLGVACARRIVPIVAPGGRGNG